MKSISKVKSLELSELENSVFLDTESTGFSGQKDDLLELAIVDFNGTILFNSLIRPTKKSSWYYAQRVNGISPRMVQNAPTWKEIENKVYQLLYGKTVIAWNAKFDKRFIPKTDLIWNDAMGLYAKSELARIKGKSSYKLQVAIKENRIKVVNKHRALGDTLAMRDIVLKMFNIPTNTNRVGELSFFEQLSRMIESLFGRLVKN